MIAKTTLHKNHAKEACDLGIVLAHYST